MGFLDSLLGKKMGVDGLAHELFSIGAGWIHIESQDNWKTIRETAKTDNVRDDKLFLIIYETFICILSIGLYHVDSLAKVSEEAKKKIYLEIQQMHQDWIQKIPIVKFNDQSLESYFKTRIAVYKQRFKHDLYNPNKSSPFRETIGEILSQSLKIEGTGNEVLQQLKQQGEIKSLLMLPLYLSSVIASICNVVLDIIKKRF